MEAFEIHITGDSSICEHAQSLGLKTIVVDLLKPDLSVLRSEYMTSQIMHFENYEKCFCDIVQIVKQLQELGTKIIRIKIESPYYQRYENMSLYMESHFETQDRQLPVSRNQRKTTLLATDRVYKLDQYSEFREKYKGGEIELCLFDSDVYEDKDWFDLYEKGLSLTPTALQLAELLTLDAASHEN